MFRNGPFYPSFHSSERTPRIVREKKSISESETFQHKKPSRDRLEYNYFRERHCEVYIMKKKERRITSKSKLLLEKGCVHDRETIVLRKNIILDVCSPNLWKKTFEVLLSNKLDGLLDDFITVLYNYHRNIHFYDKISHPNHQMSSFSKSYQQFITHLHYVHEKTKTHFNLIPKDVVRHKIIPFLMEVDAFYTTNSAILKTLIKIQIYDELNTYAPKIEEGEIETMHDLSSPWKSLHTMAKIRKNISCVDPEEMIRRMHIAKIKSDRRSHFYLNFEKNENCKIIQILNELFLERKEQQQQPHDNSKEEEGKHNRPVPALSHTPPFSVLRKEILKLLCAFFHEGKRSQLASFMLLYSEPEVREIEFSPSLFSILSDIIQNSDNITSSRNIRRYLVSLIFPHSRFFLNIERDGTFDVCIPKTTTFDRNKRIDLISMLYQKPDELMLFEKFDPNDVSLGAHVLVTYKIFSEFLLQTKEENLQDEQVSRRIKDVVTTLCWIFERICSFHMGNLDMDSIAKHVKRLRGDVGFSSIDPSLVLRRNENKEKVVPEPWLVRFLSEIQGLITKLVIQSQFYKNFVFCELIKTFPTPFLSKNVRTPKIFFEYVDWMLDNLSPETFNPQFVENCMETYVMILAKNVSVFSRVDVNFYFSQSIPHLHKFISIITSREEEKKVKEKEGEEEEGEEEEDNKNIFSKFFTSENTRITDFVSGILRGFRENTLFYKSRDADPDITVPSLERWNGIRVVANILFRVMSLYNVEKFLFCGIYSTTKTAPEHVQETKTTIKSTEVDEDDFYRAHNTFCNMHDIAPQVTQVKNNNDGHDGELSFIKFNSIMKILCFIRNVSSVSLFNKLKDIESACLAMVEISKLFAILEHQFASHEVDACFRVEIENIMTEIHNVSDNFETAKEVLESIELAKNKSSTTQENCEFFLQDMDKVGELVKVSFDINHHLLGRYIFKPICYIHQLQKMNNVFPQQHVLFRFTNYVLQIMLELQKLEEFSNWLHVIEEFLKTYKTELEYDPVEVSKFRVIQEQLFEEKVSKLLVGGDTDVAETVDERDRRGKLFMKHVRFLLVCSSVPSVCSIRIMKSFFRVLATRDPIISCSLYTPRGSTVEEIEEEKTLKYSYLWIHVLNTLFFRMAEEDRVSVFPEVSDLYISNWLNFEANISGVPNPYEVIFFLVSKHFGIEVETSDQPKPKQQVQKLPQLTQPPQQKKEEKYFYFPTKLGMAVLTFCSSQKSVKYSISYQILIHILLKMISPFCTNRDQNLSVLVDWSFFKVVVGMLLFYHQKMSPEILDVYRQVVDIISQEKPEVIFDSVCDLGEFLKESTCSKIHDLRTTPNFHENEEYISRIDVLNTSILNAYQRKENFVLEDLFSDDEEKNPCKYFLESCFFRAISKMGGDTVCDRRLNESGVLMMTSGVRKRCKELGINVQEIEDQRHYSGRVPQKEVMMNYESFERSNSVHKSKEKKKKKQWKRKYFKREKVSVLRNRIKSKSEIEKKENDVEEEEQQQQQEYDFGSFMENHDDQQLEYKEQEAEKKEKMDEFVFEDVLDFSPSLKEETPSFKAEEETEKQGFSTSSTSTLFDNFFGDQMMKFEDSKYNGMKNEGKENDTKKIFDSFFFGEDEYKEEKEEDDMDGDVFQM